MILDILFLVCVIAGLAIGGKKGIVHSIFAWIALIAGLLIALWFTETFAWFLYDQFGWQTEFLPVISFIMILFGVILIVRLISKIIEGTLKFLYLNFINRLLGALLWSAIFLVVFSICLWFFDNSGMIPDSWIVGSQTYQVVMPIGPIAIGFITDAIPFMTGVFDSLMEYLNQSTGEEGQVASAVRSF